MTPRMIALVITVSKANDPIRIVCETFLEKISIDRLTRGSGVVSKAVVAAVVAMLCATAQKIEIYTSRKTECITSITHEIERFNQRATNSIILM